MKKNVQPAPGGAAIANTRLLEPVGGARGEEEQLVDPPVPRFKLQKIQQAVPAPAAAVARVHRERRHLRAPVLLVRVQRRRADAPPVALHHREHREVPHQLRVLPGEQRAVELEGPEELRDVGAVVEAGVPHALVHVHGHHRALADTDGHEGRGWVCGGARLSGIWLKASGFSEP